jgi:hypothetical protein
MIISMRQPDKETAKRDHPAIHDAMDFVLCCVPSEKFLMVLYDLQREQDARTIADCRAGLSPSEDVINKALRGRSERRAHAGKDHLSFRWLFRNAWQIRTGYAVAPVWQALCSLVVPR